VKPIGEPTVGTRLQTYAVLLKQLDAMIGELEAIGFVTLQDRDRWEKLIIPERLRVGFALRALGVSVLERVPSLAAAKAAGNGSLPRVNSSLHSGIAAVDAANGMTVEAATAEYRGHPVIAGSPANSRGLPVTSARPAAAGKRS